ncbi:hypothetical protein DBR06_SOUSAS9010062, partial [Sousa chinensis]
IMSVVPVSLLVPIQENIFINYLFFKCKFFSSSRNIFKKEGISPYHIF